MAKELSGYDLSRSWFNFCFENPDKIRPNHHAVYFFAIEHCNRLGWKQRFGFPATMVLEATGIKSYSVYKKAFDDLVDFGFIYVVEYSKNQYSSNIIALKENYKANDKALDKALVKHMRKQSESTLQSTCESTNSIDKQETSNNITINKEQEIPINNFLWTNIVKSFNNDFRWKEKFCRDKNIRLPDLEIKMAEFISDIELKEDFKELKELKNHFTNWHNKNKNGLTKHTGANQRSNDAANSFLQRAKARHDAAAGANAGTG